MGEDFHLRIGQKNDSGVEQIAAPCVGDIGAGDDPDILKFFPVSEKNLFPYVLLQTNGLRRAYVPVMEVADFHGPSVVPSVRGLEIGIQDRDGTLDVELDVFHELLGAVEFHLVPDPFNEKKIQITKEGFLAIVLQHEIDHPDGYLFIDRISPAKRLMLKEQLKRIE